MLNEGGANADVIAEINTECVTRGSIRRLRPGMWLNDEIINFEMKLIN